MKEHHRFSLIQEGLLLSGEFTKIPKHLKESYGTYEYSNSSLRHIEQGSWENLKQRQRIPLAYEILYL